ncbi:MAG TPA: 50S ribosomal protein L35 [Kiritimatiellia bacterium]|jgi:large subunit ribosomal protein L35|nr:50S ribosomal protein L35 [Kiritimatiellia bacterium]HMP35049.1 50S ribosomal protein L35 [Kiritimatiellia bacterium]
MPKKKTKKSVAKRFKKTASGRVKRGKVGRRHLLGSKSRSRKRNLRKGAMVAPEFEKQIRAVLA